jgi:hypothetical protein
MLIFADVAVGGTLVDAWTSFFFFSSSISLGFPSCEYA